MAKIERKLTTIVAADVVGFSKLMGQDEAATLEALLACRSIIDEIIAEHHGRVFGAAGDSVLAEFASPVEAVICAREFQERIAERNERDGNTPTMQFRVGVNLGDVIIEGDNLYGDGVNIAARLQTVADPGGICVSSKIYEEVKRKIGISFTDGGLQAFKNIEDPVAIYHVGDAKAVTAAAPVPAPIASGSGSKVPKVAVHALRTIGGAEDAAELAEGLMEDIRDGLGHHTAIAVIAGDDGAADFVLEGSVRASGARLRVVFALLEGSNRRQVWSERYDRTLDDIFDLQDEISRNVVSTIRVRVKAQVFESLAEAENDSLSVPELLDKAAGYFVRGYGNNDAAEAALELALAKAPDNSMASGMLAFCLHRKAEFSAAALPVEVGERIATLARQAVELAPESYFARLISGLARYDLDGDFEGALGDARTALEHNASFTQAQALEGIARIHLGEVEDGLNLLGRAIDANKSDPHRFRHYRELAIGQYVAGRTSLALEIIGHLVEQAPDLNRNRLVLAVLSQRAGATEKARQQLTHLDGLPAVRQSFIANGDACARYEASLSEVIAMSRAGADNSRRGPT